METDGWVDKKWEWEQREGMSLYDSDNSCFYTCYEMLSRENLNVIH